MPATSKPSRASDRQRRRKNAARENVPVVATADADALVFGKQRLGAVRRRAPPMAFPAVVRRIPHTAAAVSAPSSAAAFLPLAAVVHEVGVARADERLLGRRARVEVVDERADAEPRPAAAAVPAAAPAPALVVRVRARAAGVPGNAKTRIAYRQQN